MVFETPTDLKSQDVEFFGSANPPSLSFFDRQIVRIAACFSRFPASPRSTPFLRALVVRGQITPDPLRLGIHTAPDGSAIGPDGTAQNEIYSAGPLARGTAGELMGVPEVTVWAEFIARRVLLDLHARLPEPANPCAG